MKIVNFSFSAFKAEFIKLDWKIENQFELCKDEIDIFTESLKAILNDASDALKLKLRNENEKTKK